MKENQNSDDIINTTSDNKMSLEEKDNKDKNETTYESSGQAVDPRNNVTLGVSDKTEVLDIIDENKINQSYEEVEPQYQEVSIEQKPQRTDSYFDGGLLELIGWRLLGFLITIVTLGIATPWAKCMLYGYQYNHTVYNGKRLKFEGHGGDLFVNYFKWIFLSIITLGIYLFFIPVRKQQWIVSHLHFEDEDYIKGESFFDGKTLHLIGVNILCLILNTISFGLLFTFTTCFKLKWLARHTIINKKRIAFTGGALNLFGKILLWIFLTLITFGIYGLWLRIKMLKWTTKNTHIKVVGEIPPKDNSLVFAIIIGLIGIVLFALAAPHIVKAIDESGIIDQIENGNISNPLGKSESSMQTVNNGY